jgi:bifunctional UDP-N-acetylglucosamine pyrophosphorylase / glucosamine-1-phosphate N-acetyltransferase
MTQPDLMDLEPSNPPKPLRAVVMAAGQGTRMRSALPKVLHPLLGRPMVGWVLEAARDAGCEAATVIVGHGREAVEAYVRGAFPPSPSFTVRFAHQAQQLGTAHAVQQALPSLEGFTGRVLILNGDLPCLPTALLRGLCEVDDEAPKALSVISAVVEEPQGYGRVTRDEAGAPQAIVEHKDCDAAQRQIREVNTGIYLADAKFLTESLGRVENRNAQAEFYLTDLLAMAAQGGSARAHIAPDPTPLLGVNDRAQLAVAQRWLQRQVNGDWMRRGVTFLLPNTALVEYAVRLGEDVTVGPGAHLMGCTRVGAGAVIGAHVVLEDADIPAGEVVQAGQCIRGARPLA